MTTEDKAAEIIEKYRNDNTMTSHRIARMILTTDKSSSFYYKASDEEQKEDQDWKERLSEWNFDYYREYREIPCFEDYKNWIDKNVVQPLLDRIKELEAENKLLNSRIIW